MFDNCWQGGGGVKNWPKIVDVINGRPPKTKSRFLNESVIAQNMEILISFN